MADDSLPDEKAALPIQRQSLWFPTVPASAADRSQDEPKDLPPPKQVTSAASILGWKAPARVRVPIFERDAAEENTTPVDASGVVENPVPGDAVRDFPRYPTADDETVRQLREHIVPVPMPPDVDDDESATAIARADAAARIAFGDFDVAECRRRMEAGGLARAAWSTPTLQDDPDFQEVRIHRGNVDFHATRSPLDKSVVLTLDFLDLNLPPKGAKAARAPVTPACGRDGATPNDGVVPQDAGASIGTDGAGQRATAEAKTWDRAQLAQAVDFWWKLVGTAVPVCEASLDEMVALWLRHHRGAPGVHSDYAEQFVNGVGIFPREKVRVP
jgi:hypothetical protein